MFDWLKQAKDKVKKLNKDVSEYTKDTVIQALPSVAFVNKAKKLIEEEKLDEAEIELKKAMEFPAKDALAYKYIGIIYDKKMKFNDAVEMYQKSADLNPEDKNIWQKLGFALIAIHEYSRAEKSFDNANKISPLNTDTFTGWGMALMKLKKYAEAREKFMEAAKCNRYNFSAIFMAAVMEINLGLYDDAEMKLKFLVNTNPNEANNYEYAHLKFLRHNYEDTIFYAKKALDYNSKMLPVYLILGQVYALNFDEENSTEAFKKAEDLNLVNENLYLEWGKALIRFSDYEKAKYYLLKAYELNNSNVEIIENLTLINVLVKDLKDIPLFIEKLNEVAPESIILKQSKAILNYINNDFKTAISGLKETVEIVDNNFIDYFYIAKSYEALNESQKAKDNYDSAILKNPNYLNAYIEYSKFLINNKNYAEAQRKLRKAIKISPENVTVLNLLFHVSYILVKDNLCEYNIKETIEIANKITPELFEYQEELEELKNTNPKESD